MLAHGRQFHSKRPVDGVADHRWLACTGAMNIPALLLALLCLTFCSCDHGPKVKFVGGDDPAWISADETRQVGEQLILSRYPKAQVISELGVGPTVTYRFATNGTVLPVSAVVDRKTGKARFESSKQ